MGLKIDEDVIDPEDSEMLEDLVIAAVNDALKKLMNIAEKQWAN